MTNKKGKKEVNAYSKALASLVIFGGLFSNSGMFLQKPNDKKKCLNCTTIHSHNNAFCSVYCCHAWREVNPQKGRGNHYFGEFNLACRVQDGVEQVLS